MTGTGRGARWAILVSAETILVCLAFAFLVVVRRAIAGPALSTQAPSLLTANHAAAVGFSSVFVAVGLRLLFMRWPRRTWLPWAAVSFGVIAVLVGLAAMLNGVPPAYRVLRYLAVWHDTELDLIAPNAGAIMVLGGLTVALLDWQPRWEVWPAQWFAVANAVLGGIGLLGYAYGIGALYRIGNSVPMAISSALGAVFMSLAALSARPDRGLGLLLQGDVADEGRVRTMVDAVVKEYGRLDILINNAGTTFFVDLSDLEGMTEEKWDRIYDVNVKGLFWCCRAAAPALREARGQIINVSSKAGITGSGSSLAYAASKAAVIALTKGLASVLAPEVRVNTVAPGMVDSPWNTGRESRVAGAAKSSPLRRVASAEDIASVILDVAAGFSLATGSVIVIDGGAGGL